MLQKREEKKNTTSKTVEEESILTRAYRLKRLEPTKLEETSRKDLERAKQYNKKWCKERKEGKQLKTGFWNTHDQNLIKRKDSWFLIYQILDCCNREANKTATVSKIQFPCEMSYYQMKYYTQLLEWNGMLTRQEVFLQKKDGTLGKGGNGKRIYYTITEKGECFMLKYRLLHRVFFNISDGLKLFRDPDE